MTQAISSLLSRGWNFYILRLTSSTVLDIQEPNKKNTCFIKTKWFHKKDKIEKRKNSSWQTIIFLCFLRLILFYHQGKTYYFETYVFVSDNLFFTQKFSKNILFPLSFSCSLILKSIFNNIKVSQYTRLCYALPYCWSWASSIQILLFSFHQEIKLISIDGFFGVILFIFTSWWFQLVLWFQLGQSWFFQNEIEANRNWMFCCPQSLYWAFWHGQDFSLWGT